MKIGDKKIYWENKGYKSNPKIKRAVLVEKIDNDSYSVINTSRSIFYKMSIFRSKSIIDKKTLDEEYTIDTYGMEYNKKGIFNTEKQFSRLKHAKGCGYYHVCKVYMEGYGYDCPCDILKENISYSKEIHQKLLEKNKR